MNGQPIQELSELQDERQRELVTQGLSVTLEANLAHLRAIKDTELQWLNLFSLITLPAIGYLMSVSDRNAIWGWPLIVLMASYLIVTAGVQYAQLRERLSYYSVLRAVVRAQNLFGLIRIGYLSEHFANSAFPKGFGPNPELDGTQPQSSFLRRQLYTVLLFAGLLGAAFFRTPVYRYLTGVFALAMFIADVLWLACLFRWSRDSLASATAAECSLAGADPRWFPSEGISAEAAGRPAS